MIHLHNPSLTQVVSLVMIFEDDRIEIDDEIVEKGSPLSFKVLNALYPDSDSCISREQYNRLLRLSFQRNKQKLSQELKNIIENYAKQN